VIEATDRGKLGGKFLLLVEMTLVEAGVALFAIEVG